MPTNSHNDSGTCASVPSTEQAHRPNLPNTCFRTAHVLRTIIIYLNGVEYKSRILSDIWKLGLILILVSIKFYWKMALPIPLHVTSSWFSSDDCVCITWKAEKRWPSFFFPRPPPITTEGYPSQWFIKKSKEVSLGSQFWRLGIPRPRPISGAGFPPLHSVQMLKEQTGAGGRNNARSSLAWWQPLVTKSHTVRKHWSLLMS